MDSKVYSASMSFYFERIGYCRTFVLNLYIYIAVLEVHTNQKRFHFHASVAQMQWYFRVIVCEDLLKVPTQQLSRIAAVQLFL